MRGEKMFIKCLMINMALIIFMSTMYTSQAVAQFPFYSNSFISSPFFISNIIPSYLNNNISSTYNISYPVMGLLLSLASWPSSSTGNKNYTNWISDVFNKNNQFLTYLEYSGNNSYGLYGQYYPISLYYNRIYGFLPNTLLPYAAPDTLPLPSTAQIIPLQTSPLKLPVTRPYLPSIMIMEWQSKYRTDEYDNRLKGYFILDRINNLLTIQGSYFSFGKGSLTEFEYIPMSGYMSMSFKAKFDSGHIAAFRGTIYNNINSFDPTALSSSISGEYTILGLSMVEDEGNFKYPYRP